MIRNGAITAAKILSMIAIVGLVSTWTASMATGESLQGAFSVSLHSSDHPPTDNTAHITGMNSRRLLYDFKTMESQDRHSRMFLTTAASPAANQEGNQQSQADLLAIFRLAIEEFTFLAGLHIHLKSTERYIDELATKLKLKGEIFISSPSGPPYGRSQHTFNEAAHASGMLSYFVPHNMKWNLGINPDDLSVFIDLRVNAHVSLSGEFGDENQVGLYFKIPF